MKLDVNGVTLHYEKSGQGRPLIMLHGNGETHKIFDKAVPLLSERFTVYAIDTRGHGESSVPTEYHYDDMAEDVQCFIEALGLVKPVLYGFSDGAIIGILLVSRNQELLSELILSGANTTPDGVRNGWMWLFKTIDKRVHDKKMEMMFSEPHITAEDLSRITVPTLVLAGARDMVKRRDTEFIAANIKGCKKKIIWWSGHGGYIVHRKTVAKLIMEFDDKVIAKLT